MNLKELAAAVNSLEKARNHSVLIYGDPKSGKTRLAATIAKMPEVQSVYWFDCENGSDTLVNMLRSGALTEEHAAKFQVYKVLDMPDRPIAIDTVLNALVVQKPMRMCVAHGRRSCPECLKLDAKFEKPDIWHPVFDLTKLTHRDWVVIDSGSQVGTSAIEYASKGFGYDQKLGFDEWGQVGRMLTDLLSTIQAAPYCNYIVITHQLMLEKKDVERKLVGEKSATDQLDKIYPLMGTKPFSVNVAKYFGTVIYTDIRMNKHVGGSSSTYKSDVITGSRIGMVIEKEEHVDLSTVLQKLGIYGQATSTVVNTETKK